MRFAVCPPWNPPQQHLQLAPSWCGTRWWKAVATQIAGALGVSLWQCEATFLFMGSRRRRARRRARRRQAFWLAAPPPVPTAVVGRNRWCRLPPRKASAAAAFCLHAHLVSLWQCQATVLWAPEGDVPDDVPGDVRHLVGAEIDGVVCHPGNPPLRLHSAQHTSARALGRSRWHTDWRSLGSEPLAMPGNCFMGSRRRRARRRASRRQAFWFAAPPRCCGQK